MAVVALVKNVIASSIEVTACLGFVLLGIPTDRAATVEQIVALLFEMVKLWGCQKNVLSVNVQRHNIFLLKWS